MLGLFGIIPFLIELPLSEGTACIVSLKVILLVGFRSMLDFFFGQLSRPDIHDYNPPPVAPAIKSDSTIIEGLGFVGLIFCVNETKKRAQILYRNICDKMALKVEAP